MLKRIPDPDVWRLYAATVLLGLAYGIAIAVIAVYLKEIGLKDQVGSLGTWFAVGIATLSIPAGGLVKRFGARNVLTGGVVVYGVSVGIFPLLEEFEAIAAARFVDGAASVCVWLASETFLLHRAGNKNKALATSLYAVSLGQGYIVGPLIAYGLAVFAPLYVAFYLSAGLALVAAVYIVLRMDRRNRRVPVENRVTDAAEASEAEAEELPEPSPVRAVAWRIKTSLFATFSYGYFQASVVLFLPLALIQEKGIDKEDTFLLPGFFALGMVLFSNPAGRLGDRIGHLLTMRILACIGVAAITGFVFLDAYWLMATATFVAGATLAAISPVSLGLQGVCVGAQDYERATSLYNAIYALGMILGPPTSGWLFNNFGGFAMLYHLAALWLTFVAFSAVFLRDDPAARRSPQQSRVSPKPERVRAPAR